MCSIVQRLHLLLVMMFQHSNLCTHITQTVQHNAPEAKGSEEQVIFKEYTHQPNTKIKILNRRTCML